jgi:hypothetical protein
MDQRVFPAWKIDSSKTGWIADMSSGDAVNPDCYFSFSTRAQANLFVRLVDSGKRADEAVHIVETTSSAAAVIASLGGKVNSQAQNKARAANGKLGGRPRKPTAK